MERGTMMVRLAAAQVQAASRQDDCTVLSACYHTLHCQLLPLPLRAGWLSTARKEQSQLVYSPRCDGECGGGGCEVGQLHAHVGEPGSQRILRRQTDNGGQQQPRRQPVCLNRYVTLI